MQLRSVYVGILAHHGQLCHNVWCGVSVQLHRNSVSDSKVSVCAERTVLSETRVVLRGSRAGRVTRRAALECAVDHVRYIGTVHRCSLRCCRTQSEFRTCYSRMPLFFTFQIRHSNLKNTHITKKSTLEYRFSCPHFS